MLAGLSLLLALTLAADPPRLRAGEPSGSALHIAAPAEARLSLWCSSGELSKPSFADGAWTARYTPSPETFPRVVLLLVTAQGGGRNERAWAAITIDGRDSLQLSTKPSSRVEVQIADRSFGPVRSDRQGRARIPVVVPPGVHTAAILVRDKFGNQTETAFDLRPPAFQRLRMVAAAETASWADPAPLSIEIFAVDASGAPARRADLTVSADRGELGALEERAPGLFVIPFRGPEHVDGASATIEAHLFGDPGAPERAKVALRPGPPARIDLKPSSMTATPAALVKFEATVADARGNPLPDAPLALETDAGTLTGSRSAQLVAPASFAGLSAMHVTARAGAAQSRVAIALAPGSPARLQLHFGAREVREGEDLDATVEVADTSGNPVPGATLNFEPLGIAVLQTRDLGRGNYALRLRALPASAPAAALRVNTGASGIAARLPVVAAEKPWSLAAGASLIGQHNFSRAACGGVELEVAGHSGVDWLELFGRAQGMQFAPVTNRLDGGGSQVATLQAFGTMLGARFLVPLHGAWAVHVGGDAGAVRTVGTLRIQGGVADGVSERTAHWSPAVAAGAGGSLRLGPGRLMAEAQLAAVPSSGMVEGNLGGLWLRAGWLFDLR